MNTSTSTGTTGLGFPALQSAEHEVLGTEFCSGYSDSDGQWNSGFYCPQSESHDAVLCCGTPSYKYCCNGFLNLSEITSSSTPGSFPVPAVAAADESSSFVDFGPLLIDTPLLMSGIVCGVVVTVAIVLAVLVACYYCSCCILYRKLNVALNGNGNGNVFPNPSDRDGMTLYHISSSGGMGLGFGSGLSPAPSSVTSSGIGTGSQSSGSVVGTGPSLSAILNTINGPSNSSTTTTPLVDFPGVGVGVNGRDFVYTSNQWQTAAQAAAATESVYNNSASSSSGIYSIYSNPSSSSCHTYAYPAAAPAYQNPYSYTYSYNPAPGPQQQFWYPQPGPGFSDSNWCYNGAAATPAPAPPPPPPYNFSQRQHMNNRPAPGAARRLQATPAEIALYERILAILLKESAGVRIRDPQRSCSSSSALPKVTNTHKATTTTTATATATTIPSESVNQNQSDSGSRQQQSRSDGLRAKSVNQMPSSSRTAAAAAAHEP